MGNRTVDLLGRRFGRLVVTARAPSDGQRAAWVCHCDCGQTRTVKAIYLLTGDTRSCGCLHVAEAIKKGRARRIDLTGKRFGRLLVVREDGRRREIVWLCLCDCGRECTVLGSVLRRGQWQSCGCRKRELCRERAPRVGAIVRRKKCRTCRREYDAVGPQKECSDYCRLLFHARNEARRRDEDATTRAAGELAALSTELERRLEHGQESTDA